MNQEEFAQVVVEATDSLYRVSFAILGNDTDCKDAISEAIVIAFTKLYTLRNADYAKTWLTRILIHECYRILKIRKRLLPAGDEMEHLMEGSKHSEDYTDLYEALMALPKEQRTVIVLYYLEGYSVKEIARLTKTMQGTVMSRLARARKHLRDILGQSEQEVRMI